LPGLAGPRVGSRSSTWRPSRYSAGSAARPTSSPTGASVPPSLPGWVLFSPCRSIGQKALGNLLHPMLQGRRLGNRRRLWRGARLDAALEKRQVKRAYKLYAPAYDFVFDWIFHPGREAAIRLLDIKPGDNVLEVGIGTGLNLPLYPPNCRLTGIDLSEEMLEKAQDKVVELGLGNVTLSTMDATVMDFDHGEFDSAVATYTISAVPDPVGVLREMKRVVKPGSNIVILNHFRSERPAVGPLEDLVAPVYTRRGWKSNLPAPPLRSQVGLTPDLTHKVHLFNGRSCPQCLTHKTRR